MEGRHTYNYDEEMKSGCRIDCRPRAMTNGKTLPEQACQDLARIMAITESASILKY
jgi:hypothetical protein